MFDIWPFEDPALTLAVELGSFPLVFKGATGWFCNFKQNKDRYADIYGATRPFTNHPVCAAKERDLFIDGADTPP
jgi:hypothetical protein